VWTKTMNWTTSPLITWRSLWLLMVIILVAIGCYSIGGYWWLFIVIILPVILLMDIARYFINGYCWLFY